MRVIEGHKRKPIEFQHDIRNGKILLQLPYQIQVRQQQMIGGRCEPAGRSPAVVEPCFLVSNALAGNGFLITGQ